MNAAVAQLINEQINKEFYSALSLSRLCQLLRGRRSRRL